MAKEEEKGEGGKEEEVEGQVARGGLDAGGLGRRVKRKCEFGASGMPVCRRIGRRWKRHSLHRRLIDVDRQKILSFFVIVVVVVASSGPQTEEIEDSSSP